jgi:NFU1 iron-sulfur cluster scaffold homolog, mitochondrial
MFKQQIFIYTEATPNPNSMKFVLNFELAPESLSFDYSTIDEAISKEKESPLAIELFGFDFIRRVFISSNFVTVTKDEATEWENVLFDMKQFFKAYFEDKKPVFAESTMKSLEVTEGDSETVQKIKLVLNDYIRPAVESDGGAINFHSFNEGVVTVLLQGSCSGCPSSTITLKNGIENLLTRMVPEVKEVVAEGV